MYLYPPTIFGCLWQSCHSMKLVVFCLASCVLRGSCGTWSLSVANVALCLARGCAQKEYQLTPKKSSILLRPAHLKGTPWASGAASARGCWRLWWRTFLERRWSRPPHHGIHGAGADFTTKSWSIVVQRVRWREGIPYVSIFPIQPA